MDKKVVYPDFDIESLREKEQLSSIIHRFGHDIGNPLTSIISFSSILVNAGNNQSPDKSPQFSEAIIREAWRVNLLNERLVFLFSTKGGNVDFIDLKSVAIKAQQKIKTRLGLEVKLDYSENCETTLIKTDAEQLLGLTLELILNSQMHRSNQSEVLTNISTFEDQNRFGFEITNPIATDSDLPLEQLFKPFFSWPKGAKSAGIGLTTAYAIATRLGADISLSIDGSRFIASVSFPIEMKAEAISNSDTEHLPEIPNNLPQDISLLLIEDESVVSSAIEKILGLILGKQTNLSVEVTTGADAQEKLTKRSFDIILCDLNLKAASGKDIFSYLQSKQPNLLPGFAFITGDRGKQSSIDYLQSTGRPFLFKPFEPEDLLDLVFELLAEIS